VQIFGVRVEIRFDELLGSLSAHFEAVDRRQFVLAA